MVRILKKTYVGYILEQEYLGSKWESHVKKMKMVQLKLLSKQYENQGAPPICEYNTTIE